MTASAGSLISDELVEAFERDGAVPLRGLFKDWVGSLAIGIERNIASPSADVRIYDTDGGGRFFGDYCNWDRIPEFRAFIFESPIAAVAARLMRSRTVRLFHEHVLVKEPGADLATPWHQDAPYYCVGGPKTCSIWVPIDPVPRERTLEFVAGSHTWGRSFRPQRFNGAPLNEGDGREAVPDIEADRGKFPILAWPLEPGDGVAFHYTTLHGAPANTSRSARRRAFSVRMVGDDAVFVREAGKVTSPPMRDVVLADGAPLGGPQFPLLPLG